MPGWKQQVTELETRVKAIRADDRRDLDQTASSLHDLDVQVSAWLSSRGLTIEPPPAQGTRIADLAAELSRVRALITQASAGSADDPQGSGVFYLGRVDVAVSAQTAPPGVTLVDASELRLLDAKTVAQAAEMAPGVSLHRVGPRNEAMVYIRGFDLRQVPLLIDGIPVYVPYDGYVDLDRFVTDDLSEVRITKGMTSVLIGPNALGGAINLVTKRPTKPFDGLFNVTFGSGSERAFDTTVGVMRSSWYAQGTGSWLQSDNVPLSGDFVPTALEDGGARNNSSRRDGKTSLKFGFTPTGRGEYALTYVLQRGQKDVPPYAGTNSVVRPRFWQWPDWDKDSLYFVSNTPLRGSQYLKARAYYDRFYNELDSFDDARYTTMTRASSFRSIYDDYSAGGSVEYGTAIGGRQTLRAAGHLKEDIHREHNIGNPIQHFDIRTVSLGIEDTITVSSTVSVVAGIGADRQTTLQAENLVAGAIADFPPGTASGVNPQVGIFVATPEGGRVHANVSRKTRLPAIKDRYSYRMGAAIPNPDLKAEQATTAEVGYDRSVPRLGRLSLAAYYTAIDDLVQPFFLQPNLFQLQNVGNVRNSGFEGEWRSREVRSIQGRLGYSYLHRSNVEGTTVPLLNTPNHKVFGSVLYSPLPKLRLVGSLNHESSRSAQDDAGVLLSLGGYSTINGKVSYVLVQGFDAELTGSNLFDRNYVLYPGFPEAGRVVAMNLRYRY